MKNTTNYKLNLPEPNDFYNVEHYNSNFEEIDTQLKAVAEGAKDAETLGGKKASEFASSNHSHSASETGLGNVPNVTTNDQTPTYDVSSDIANLTSGEKLSVAFGKIAKAISSLIAHLNSTANPHKVTKTQVGLGNVDNTADANKSVKYATTAGSATPTAHSQSASTITAGTLGGTVKAPASTTYTTAEVRNIVIVDADVGEGTSVSYPNGTIIMTKG